MAFFDDKYTHNQYDKNNNNDKLSRGVNQNLNYKKIKPKKIYEEVAEAIHEMIRSGKLKPGDKLDSVQQLAENFQVGRSAIREALTSLRAMGLVEMKQGEGTYVKQFDSANITFPLSMAILMNKQDIFNLLEVRKIIEVGSAAAAAKKRTTEQLDSMEDALNNMKNANKEFGETADLQFHLAVTEASNNPLLIQLMNQVSGLMGESMKEIRKVWIFSNYSNLDRLYKEHMDIFKAIKEEKEEEARQAMLRHLENVEDMLKQYFNQTESMN
ncbi:transcriptional regulator, GntR family [Schinkia azotoformans MEV2011]|uniref:Transcriptional regulator, GntR family n=1 Tax=Schinkia azotoformans MEV2011 TaxID=1348973 RepID=A0A072NN88_SCHAZ|nr:transcriptional regulator, GntR family [Schinkia azotoformans MEV2011]